MKIDKRAFAVSAGIVLGLAILVVTLVFIIFGQEGVTLAKIHKLMPGYQVVWWGALLGLLWGFIYGAIGGWIFAWFYNKLAK
jgi:hypothetical protein